MEDMEGHDPLWTTGEVAAAFRVDRKTVRRWVEDGKLREVLTPGGQPRYRESEVLVLLANLDARPDAAPLSRSPRVGPGPDSQEGRPRR